MFIGPDFKVVAYSENGRLLGYNLSSGSVTFGINIAPDAADSCRVYNQGVVVQTCTRDQVCRPQGWTYSFSGSSLRFQFNECEATFTKN